MICVFYKTERSGYEFKGDKMSNQTVEHFKNNPVDFVRDYETGAIREIQSQQRKVLDMIETRCTVALHPRKMIMVYT